MGMGGRHWTFFLLRTLITIIILMVVFWFGVQVGRLNSGFRRESGVMMMRGAYGYGGGTGIVNPGGPMMPVKGVTSTLGGLPNGY
jgi:hypothetical protein